MFKRTGRWVAAAIGLILLSLGTFFAAPASAEDTWTAACSRKAAGDVLAYFQGTSANCSVNAGEQTFSVNTSAHSEGPGRSYYLSNCDYAGVNSACSSATATLTLKRRTELLPSTQSISVDLADLSVSTSNSAGYSTVGTGYSQIRATLYAYGYSCDWNWYNGWKCYTGEAVTTYLYLSCAPAKAGCDTATTTLSADVEIPYCNGYYCSHEWSVDSPYAYIVGKVSIQATSTAVGSMRSFASASGRLSSWSWSYP